MKVHEFTLILTADPNEEESDRLYGIFNEVPDFIDLSVVPKGKLTTYWASLKRP